MRRDRTYHREKAAEFLAKLNMEQKLAVVCGDFSMLQEEGLPAFAFFGEAAHGVQARHDQSFDLGNPVYTTVFQNPVGYAATWDKALMREIGELVGTEARSLYLEGKHNALYMLAPTIDMERDPRWGRNEEAYGEDPHLTSRMAGEYILGMAGDDPRYVRCGAILKHFYGNNVEDDRCCADSNISEKLKDSYYIHVFEEVIDYADPMGVMSSYNYVNGVPNTFNPELTTRLKKRGLPFVTGDGGVIDLSIVKQKEADTMAEALVKAIRAGMDIFLEDHRKVRAGLQEALEKGMLSPEELDGIAMNRLVAHSMLGQLEDPQTMERVFPRTEYNLSRVDSAEGRALARRASAEAAVLLKNEGNALPLKKEERVLLLGPFADRCPMDWYSALTSHQVTLREGLGEAALASEALYPYVRIRLGDAYAGLEGCRLVPVEKEKAEMFRIMLWDDSRITLRSVTLGKLLTTHHPEQRSINIEEPEPKFALYAYREDAFSWFVQEAFQLYDDKGEVLHFTEENVLRFWEDERIRGIRNYDGGMDLGFETVKTAEELLEEAGRKTGNPVVIAAFGLHPMVNGKEERDRTTIQLPPFQRVLLRKIREKYPRVILVLHTNSPVAIVEEQAAHEIPGILWMATGSEEYGNSLADVLYGRMSPAGRLCQTWYMSDDQLPAITDYDIEKNRTTYIYMEDEPLYRFGYGLSYTTFTQEIIGQEVVDRENVKTGKASSEDEKDLSTEGTPCNPASSSSVWSGNCVEGPAGYVTVRVRNTGNRTSDYVVQVYKRPSGEYRLYEDRTDPGCRLTAFERLKGIEPGEEVEVKLPCRY